MLKPRRIVISFIVFVLTLSLFPASLFYAAYSPPTCTTGEITADGYTLTLRIKIDTYGGDAKVNKIGWFVRKANGTTTLYEPIMTGTFEKYSESKKEYTYTLKVSEAGDYVVRAYAETIYGRGQASNLMSVTVKDNSISTIVTPTISSFNTNKSSYNTYEDITFSGSMVNTKSWIMYWIKNGKETTEEIARQNSSNISYVAINGCNSTTYDGAVLYAYSGTGQSGTKSSPMKITFTVKQVDDSITIENLHDEVMFVGDVLKISSGTIKSANSNLTKVTINIADANGNDIGVQNYVNNIGSKIYSLSGITLPTQNLIAGDYKLRIWATNATNTVGIMYKEVKLTISPKPTASILKAVEIAIGEIGNNYEKYNIWNGKINDKYDYAWCATFTTWVYTKAGISTTKTASCLTLWNYYEVNGNAKTRSSGYIPQPGDAVFFDWDGDGKGDPNMYEHVGIVEYVDANGTLHTIEGNTDKSLTTTARKVKRCERGNYKTNSEIIGYGFNGGSVSYTVLSTQLNQDRITTVNTNVYNQQSASSTVNGVLPKGTKVLVTEILTWSNGEKWAWVEFYQAGLLSREGGHYVECSKLGELSEDSISDGYTAPTCTTGLATANSNKLTLRMTIDTYGGDAKAHTIGWYVRKADGSTVLYEPIRTGEFNKGEEYTVTIDVDKSGEYIVRAYAETIYGKGQAGNTSRVTMSFDNDDITFYIPKNEVNVNIGDEIIVPVKVTGNNGISDFGITLLYDSSVLSPIYVDNGDGWSAELVSNLNYGKDRIFVSSSSSSNKSSNDTLFEVTFKVLKTDISINFNIEIDKVRKINNSNNLSSVNTNVLDSNWVIGSSLYNDYLLGDVNGDGRIDSADATLVLLHYSKQKLLDNEAVGDVNKDGKVDSADATLILLHYAGLKLIN